MEAAVEKLILKIGFKRLYKVFKVIRDFYMIIDHFTDLIFGYSLVYGRKKDRELAKAKIEKSGHLVKVLGRGSPNPAAQAFLHNFMLRHETYLDPVDFVLNHDHVTYMGMDQNQAWFCVSKSTDVYGVGKFPFAFMAQYVNAEKLLIVDIGTFLRIAEEIRDVQGDCIMINNTARCGSTLLCQMFRRLPMTLVQSEPWGLLYLHRLYNERQISWPRYQELLKACVKLQFKPTMQKESQRIVVKLPFLCASMFKPIKDIFGSKIKFMFLTRHPKPSILSFLKVISSFDPEDDDVKGDFFYGSIGLPYNDKYRSYYEKYHGMRKETSDCQAVTFGIAAVMLGFLEQNDLYEHKVLYEELMEDVETETKALFKSLNIPEKHCQEAVKALEKHSQNNMFDKGDSKTLASEKDWMEADAIFQDLKVPLRIQMTLQDLKKIVH